MDQTNDRFRDEHMVLTDRFPYRLQFRDHTLMLSLSP